MLPEKIARVNLVLLEGSVHWNPLALWHSLSKRNLCKVPKAGLSLVFNGKKLNLMVFLLSFYCLGTIPLFQKCCVWFLRDFWPSPCGGPLSPSSTAERQQLSPLPGLRVLVRHWVARGAYGGSHWVRPSLRFCVATPRFSLASVSVTATSLWVSDWWDEWHFRHHNFAALARCPNTFLWCS